MTEGFIYKGYIYKDISLAWQAANKGHGVASQEKKTHMKCSINPGPGQHLQQGDRLATGIYTEKI